MDCFKILGIEPVKDETLIRNAYFERLKTCNPEEDPKGFMELRKALEEALESLKEPEMMDPPEIRELTKKLNEIYRDFARRIEIEEWKTLLREPVCQELDKEEEAGRAILAFIMDHHRVPHHVMELLAEHFAWKERKEELEEQFPESFIGFVLNHAEYDDPIDYREFPILEDFDYDEYIGVFYRLGHAVSEREEETAKEMYEKLLTFDLEHPDAVEMKIRYGLYITQDYEEAWRLAQELIEKYGRGGTRLVAYGRAGLAAKKMEEIAPVMEEMKISEDENELKLYGDYLYYLEDYENALIYFYKAKEKSEDEWQAVEDGIRATSQKLSERYLKQLEELTSGEQLAQEPEAAAALRWKAAEASYRGCLYEKTKELLEAMEAPKGCESDYYKWLADACRGVEDYTHAAAYRENLRPYRKSLPDPSRFFWDLGCDYENDGEYEKALENFEEGRKENPDNWVWLFKKAEILYYQDKDDESIELCDKIMDEWGFISQVFNLKIKNFFDKKDYDTLIDQAEYVINQGYRSPLVFFDYASSLRRKERYDDACKYLNLLIEDNGEDGIVCEEMARVYHDKGDHKAALPWVEKAIEFEDTKPRQYLKADILSDLSRYEEEKAIYESIIESGEAYYHTYYRLAYAEEQMKQFPEAEEHYRKSLEEKPENYWARCSLADTLQKERKWEEAVEQYKKAMESPEYHKWSVWNLCRLLRRLRRLDEALSYARIGMEKFPKESCLVLTAARICRSMDDYEGAIKYFTQYAEMREDQSAYAWRSIGDNYAEAKQYEEAERAYQKALEIEEDNNVTWRIFGSYYLDDRKDPEKALPFLKKSEELDDKSDRTLKSLGDAYTKLGDEEKAAEYYARAYEASMVDVEDDPEDSCNLWSASEMLFYLKRYEEAIEMAKRAEDYVSQYFNCPYCGCQEAYEVVAWSLAALGRKEEALEYIRKAQALNKDVSDRTEELLEELTGEKKED